MYAEGWEAGAGRDELAAIARKADETGFFYIAVCDHVAIPKPLDERMNTVWYDTVATLGWLAATGLFFGLLALTHGLTMWIFAGLLAVTLIFFRPIGRGALLMLAVFLLCYSPWLVRNYMVSGTPVGLGWYSGLAGIRGTES